MKKINLRNVNCQNQILTYIKEKFKLMKIIITVTLGIILFTISSFQKSNIQTSSDPHYGIYWTEDDFLNDKIDTNYKFASGHGDEVIFFKNKKQVTLQGNTFFAFRDIFNVYYRFDEKKELLKCYAKGKLCLFAPMNFDFKNDHKTIVHSYFITDGFCGELKYYTTKKIKELVKDHEYVFTQYFEKKQDLVTMVKEYNTYYF